VLRAHGRALVLAQAVQRRNFERLLLIVIAAAARSLYPSALFITPLVERAPSAKHPKLSRLCIAQFSNPLMQRFAQLAQAAERV
jgi:hypothetical protein